MAAIGSLEDHELMPQGKNLALQCYASSKSLTNRRKEQENSREHGLNKLSWRRFKFNWVNENRAFGKDRLYLCDFIFYRTTCPCGVRVLGFSVSTLLSKCR
jgi:hypothetical protein